MSYFNIFTLLGEAGDILVTDGYYNQLFNNLRSERVDRYHRLIDLPIAIDMIYINGGIILLITVEGSLMLVDNDHPNGIILNLMIPPLKKIYNSRPLSVLDINDTLHMINLRGFISENVTDFNYDLIRYSLPDLPEDRIVENVEWIIPYDDNDNGLINRMLIKTSEGLINYYLNKGETKLLNCHDCTRIGNCVCYYEDKRKVADNGIGKFKISEDIIDIFTSRIRFYMIYENGSISLVGGNIMEPNFIPVRLLKAQIGGSIYVEDSGGNLYYADRLISNETERSINIPVILHGFKRRGQRIKRVIQEL